MLLVYILSFYPIFKSFSSIYDMWLMEDLIDLFMFDESVNVRNTNLNRPVKLFCFILVIISLN